MGVPWFVGGGAENPTEAARLLAYFATNSEQGVATASDCVPRAMVVPSGNVRVGPGALVVRNAKSNAFAEAYLLRNPEDHVVPIPATGSAGPRSDLVYAVVRDAQYEDEPDPASVEDGPYNFVERVPVAAGTRSVAEAIAQGALPVGTTGVALARVDLPANTGTVTQAMITDLRTLPAPRSQRRSFTGAPTGDGTLTSAAYATFPGAASWSVAVPAWATHAVVHIVEAGLKYGTADSDGGFRVALGNVFGQTVLYAVEAVSGKERGDFHAADTLAIPSAMRGTTQTLAMQGCRTSSSGGLKSNAYAIIVADVEFQERVS